MTRSLSPDEAREEAAQRGELEHPRSERRPISAVRVRTAAQAEQPAALYPR